MFLKLALLVFLTNLAGQQKEDDEDLPKVVYPKLVAHATAAAGFVPKGWKLEQKAEGDLNADGKPDLVMVLRDDSPANIIKPPKNSDRTFDSNPRMIAVAFADPAGGYRLVSQNHGLVPRLDNEYQEDPFEKLTVSKGVVKINLVYWTSMGTWYASSESLAFRYQDGCMRLIGLDYEDMHRATLEFTRYSINYLTGQFEKSQGVEDKKGPTVIRGALRHSPLRCLEKIDEAFEFATDVGEDAK